MTDYPTNKRAQTASQTKRSGSGTGTHAPRPLSGVGASPSIDRTSGSDQKSAGGTVGNVKNYKGPNHPFPSVDQLIAETKPEDWNNIPIPLVETIRRIMNVCLDLKKQSFDNFNEIVTNKHEANLI